MKQGDPSVQAQWDEGVPPTVIITNAIKHWFDGDGGGAPPWCDTMHRCKLGSNFLGTWHFRPDAKRTYVNSHHPSSSWVSLTCLTLLIYHTLAREERRTLSIYLHSEERVTQDLLQAKQAKRNQEIFTSSKARW
eukprot:scaffold6502_cov38-Cyclotella_meneghiniana.AAC.4